MCFCVFVSTLWLINGFILLYLHAANNAAFIKADVVSCQIRQGRLGKKWKW